MFEHVVRVREGGAWDVLGMPSSRGVKNAGMSVWIFYALGALARAEAPPELTRAVAVLAVLARVLMIAIPAWLVRGDTQRDARDRRAWIWAIVLSCTNPTSVFLDRKIWALVLPLVMVSLWIAWLMRERRAGAFVWGALSAVVGQIHMPGFFFAPMLALFTRLFDARAPERRTRWSWWIAGAILGALPAVPWLLYLARDRPHPTGSSSWLRFRLEFYQYFLSDPTGLAGQYTLGDDIVRALRWPLLSGRPTWLLLGAYVVLAVASAILARRALVMLWEERRSLGVLARGGDGATRSDTSLAIAAGFVGMGALMTLPSISIHRHYLYAAFPLPYLLFAKVALRQPGGERWLYTLFGATAIVSASLLSYVHDVGENAEMGKTYRLQQELGITPEQAKPKGHP